NGWVGGGGEGWRGSGRDGGRGFHVDNKVKPVRLFDRELGRIGALEDAIHMRCGATPVSPSIKTVGHEKPIAGHDVERGDSRQTRALAIDVKSLGPEHPDVATDLDNLAALLKDTNRLAGAESLMRRALAIDEKSYGPNHPYVGIRLNNLALLRAELSDWVEAARLHRRAKAIMTAAGHPQQDDD